MSIILHQKALTIAGFKVTVDDQLGHLMIAHDGRITWDEIQRIKNEVWGRDARAIEVYPRERDVVNSGNYRHLWRLGEGDFCPDLLQHKGSDVLCADTLEKRHLAAWAEAEEVFR